MHLSFQFRCHMLDVMNIPGYICFCMVIKLICYIEFGCEWVNVCFFSEWVHYWISNNFRHRANYGYPIMHDWCGRFIFDCDCHFVSIRSFVSNVILIHAAINNSASSIVLWSLVLKNISIWLIITLRNCNSWYPLSFKKSLPEFCRFWLCFVVRGSAWL